MASPLWFHHASSLAHDVPGHPERPARILGLERAMAAHDWFGWRRLDSPAASRTALTAVHPESHVAYIEALSDAGGGAIDMDTACVSATWEAAVHAAGGAVALVDALLSGEAPCGFSAHRPPGHHAEKDRAMGFCFLNNVAVAAAHARAAHGVERVLVFDWDVHHGNGTQEIFYDTSEVLFVSAHQWPLYPGTGPASETGGDGGEGHTVNLPVPPGSGDAVYCSLAEHVVAPLVRAYEPGLVLVSAGFDAHYADPLASCRVTEDGFATMTGSLRRACADVGAPIGLVLEGGYSVEALADSVCRLVPVLGAPDPPAATDVPRHHIAADAAQRMSGWWPALGPTA